MFEAQLKRTLCSGTLNYNNAFDGFVETCERLVISQGLDRWEI